MGKFELISSHRNNVKGTFMTQFDTEKTKCNNSSEKPIINQKKKSPCKKIPASIYSTSYF